MSTGQVIHLESVDSTNEYLKRQGALLPDGTVVVADHQTAGKGRLGRSWQDAPGQSLLASWLLKSLQGDALLLLPLAAGMAVLDALDKGCRLTCVDVRPTVTGLKAQQNLCIRPGTDLALNLAVLHVLIEEKLYDAA